MYKANSTTTLSSDMTSENSLLVHADTLRCYQIISELTSDFGYCFRVEPDGNLILEWMTESVTRNIGYLVDDINKLTWISFIYPEDIPVVIKQYERLLCGHADVAEFRVVFNENTLMWLRNHARPEWDRNSLRVVRLYGAAQDITAQKRDQAQIENLNRRLRRTLTESFHRIKNSLQRVAFLLDMQATDNGDLPADRVEQVRAHLHTLAAVHDLLTQGTKEDGQEQSVSAGALLESLFSLLRRINADRRLHYSVEDISMSGHQATSLAVIVNELVQNAVKYSRSYVEVTFRLEPVLQDADSEHRSAVLEVCDDGSGFAADFDPQSCVTTGLPLVQDLAASDLAGKLVFENGSEGGARVRVHFPYQPHKL